MTVVVGVDGSGGALAAVRWAARHAADIGAPLRLAHAMTATDAMSAVGPVVPGPFGVADIALTRPGRSGDELLATASAEAARHLPQVRITVHWVSDTPAAALVDASWGARRLVVGSTGRGQWATLFGSVTARVVGAAHCPVVVVRGDAEPAGPVVVAVDGSDHCEPALQFAFLEASRRRCALFAVHAWQIPLAVTGAGLRSAAMAPGPLADYDVAAGARRALTDALAPWRGRFPDVAAHERLLQGPPELVMADETAGAALVVVGSRGRGPLAGLLLGSTSQALTRTAKCPVAVVRDTTEPR